MKWIPLIVLAFTFQGTTTRTQLPGGLGHRAPAAERAPVLTTDFDQRFILVSDHLEFSVFASDPGDRIDLRLTNPPSGLDVSPISNALSTAEFKVRWFVPGNAVGWNRLMFEARDRDQPWRKSTLTVEFLVLGRSDVNFIDGNQIQIGDVTGDGELDLIATSRHIVSATEIGVVYVWSGTTTPNGAPTKTLSPTTPFARRSLGEGAGQGLQLADVTGDGILDIVATAMEPVLFQDEPGAIFIWAGGPTIGDAGPSATLLGQNDADPGTSSGLGTILVDVTGDGILDVVAGAPDEDIGGVANVGAVYVWAGGASLTGTPAPLAKLIAPGMVEDTWLGHTKSQGIMPGDVSGDGIVDLVIAAPGVYDAAVIGPGAVYVWLGGPTLTGNAPPSATLVAAGSSGLTLGLYFHQSYPKMGLLLDDVTGDGTLDVIALTDSATVGAIETGAAYVWAGGARLTGQLQPTATLSVPGAVDVGLGTNARGRTLLTRDVSGDGVLDLIIPALLAEMPASASGAIHVWNGGPGLTGSISPTASLVVERSGARLGVCGSQSVVLGDVTGDGVCDILSGSMLADLAFSNTGAAYVWAGGPSLSGTIGPLATLKVAGALQGDRLGDMNASEVYSASAGLLMADYNGDGVLDVMGAAPKADVAGKTDAGALYLWPGGPGLTGLQNAAAELTAISPKSSDYLGMAAGLAVRVADVTGDGLVDIIAAAGWATHGGITNAGAIFVWNDAASLSGPTTATARLILPDPAPNDHLGESDSTPGNGFHLADATGDGVLDVIAATHLANRNGVINSGAVSVWAGRPSLSGTLAPTMDMGRTTAMHSDQLGSVRGRRLQLWDLRGNGTLDLVLGAGSAYTSAAPGAGLILIWTQLQSTATHELSVPDSTLYEYLGR